MLRQQNGHAAPADPFPLGIVKPVRNRRQGNTQPAAKVAPAAQPQPVREKPLRDVLTLTEAAAFLRMSPRTLRRKALEAGIPFRRVGDRWLFSRRGLEIWLGGQGVTL